MGKKAISQVDTAKSVTGHDLSKLLTFMAKVVPDGEGIVFADDGKTHMILQANSSDSQSVTAILPTGGRVINPVMLRRHDFLKAYRKEAHLSGSDGSLQMSLGHWKLKLAGAVEAKTPEPIVVEGKKLVADVDPLKSVQTEDSYGGSTWAIFLPDGLAAVVSTYSMVCIVMDAEIWPSKPVTMQANAIYPLLNLDDPELVVGEYAIGISGKFPCSKETSADIRIALAKPTADPPSPDDIKAMVPSKKHRLSVPAQEMRVCIEGAKKTFDEEATNLTFALADAGLSISLQSNAAKLTEIVPYVKRPEKVSGKLVINTDVAVNAFKSVKELTSNKAVACIRWDETAVYIRIVNAKEDIDGKFIGAIVIAASEE
jgi:predicted secreted protein